MQLHNVGDEIRIALTSPVAAQFLWSGSFIVNNYNLESNAGLTNDTTEVVVRSAGIFPIAFRSFFVFNPGPSSSTVRIIFRRSFVSYVIHSAQLDSGESLSYTHTGGFVSFTNKGEIKNTGSGGGGSSLAVSIEYFSSSGTWFKPANLVYSHVVCIGGGGGGGSGRSANSGNVRFGGGGGAPGRITDHVFLASMLPASCSVTIGAGGSGGSGVTGTSNGNAGSAGGSTIFGGVSGALGFLLAGGGGGGSGGTNSAGAGGSAVAFASNQKYYQPSGGNGSSGTGGNAQINTLGPSGGGGGGGRDASDTSGDGGNSARVQFSLFATNASVPHASAGRGGTISSPDGTSGTSGIVDGSSYIFWGGGGGGGYGLGGNGGDGGAPGGGGGGGGAGDNTLSTASGSGGNGANGGCIVISYYNT